VGLGFSFLPRIPRHELPVIVVTQGVFSFLGVTSGRLLPCLSGIQKGKDNKKRKLSDQFQNPIRKSEKQTISILLARICIHVRWFSPGIPVILHQLH
jgi:hypothetical protein